MNLQARVRITSVLLYLYRVRFYSLRFIAHHLLMPSAQLLCIPTNRHCQQRFTALKKSVSTFQTKVEAFVAECRVVPVGGRSLTEIHRLEVIKSELLSESHGLRARMCELQSPKPSGGNAIAVYMLSGVQLRMIRLHRKTDALTNVLTGIRNSATYYWDLLLCFILPSSYVEDALGDLVEEYDLRRAADGELAARAWYREQVTGTITDRIWIKIERLAAIVTLVDFWRRLFRG